MAQKIIFYLTMLFLWSKTLHAQIEPTLPALGRLNQSSYLNPAILPAYKYSLGIPGLSGAGVQFGMIGLKIPDAINSIDDSNRLDLGKLHERITEDALSINVYTNVELIHFRFKIKNWYLGINANNRLISHTNISKDLLGLIIQGNAYYTGKTANGSNTQITNIAFNEYGISATRNINRFNVGARFKMYQGISTFFTESVTLKQTTPLNPTDSIRIQLAGVLRTSGINYLKDSIGNRKATEEEKNDVNPATFNNRGMGIDLGITFDVSNKLTLGASITDLGARIKWKNKTYAYDFNDLDYSFMGLNYNQVRYDSVRTSYLDSVGKLFKNTGISEQFTTAIPTRYFLSANYQLNSKNSIGIMFQGHYGVGQPVSAYTLSYARRFGKRFDITTNYTKVSNLDAGIGLGLAFKAGVCQIYLIQDNILFYVDQSKSAFINFRFGINFVWGEITRPVKVY